MQIVDYTELAAGVAFLLLILRIAYILSANPIGELAQEFVYLRMEGLKAPAVLLLSILMLESVEFMYPFLEAVLQLEQKAYFSYYLNAIQALLLLIATSQVFFMVRRYTHRGLERRIRETMEALAFLQGQRRRRRRPRREEE